MRFFEGPDRLEFWPKGGRPIRKGTPEELSLSDADYVRRLIEAGREQEALEFLEYLHVLYTVVMVPIFHEWATRFQEQFFPHEPGPPALDDVLAPAQQLFAKLKQNLDTPLFEAYFQEVRERHDELGARCADYAERVERERGQAASEAAIRQSLTSVSIYQGLWEVTPDYNPEELAAILAEHLRTHFSGPGRQGQVTVVEEPDRYRLIFDPCGSGGNWRRTRRMGTMPEATPYTWGRAGQVPHYCAHCALNELISVEKFGYPAWVTEFDPDAARPCGWTVYKRPEAIPEEYFTRLGVSKDPLRFRRTGGGD